MHRVGWRLHVSGGTRDWSGIAAQARRVEVGNDAAWAGVALVGTTTVGMRKGKGGRMLGFQRSNNCGLFARTSNKIYRKVEMNSVMIM